MVFDWSGGFVNRIVEYRNRRLGVCEDMPRKPIDTRLTENPRRREGQMPLPLPPARMGSGEARKGVKGQCPLRVQGSALGRISLD